LGMPIKFLWIAIGLSTVCACASTTNAVRVIERKTYNPWENEIGYSQVVKAGNTLYISGIASNKPTLERQVEEIYSTIQSILNDYSLDASSIVKQVIYTTDIEAYKSLGAAGKKYFKENEYPSSTLVQIERLYSKGRMVEIEVVAYIGRI
jgi:2-iminobutanoate/2-iminopropanoate deaminase